VTGPCECIIKGNKGEKVIDVTVATLAKSYRDFAKKYS